VLAECLSFMSLVSLSSDRGAPRERGNPVVRQRQAGDGRRLPLEFPAV